MADQGSGITSALNEIHKLTNEQLKELFNSTSNEKFDEFVNQSDKVKSLESERELLMASVKSLAEFNLAKRSAYEADKSQLLSAVSDSIYLKEEIEKKAIKLLELSKKTSLESSLAVVLASTAETEEDSENIAKSFLDNTIDYDTFISQYTEKRKLAHLRRIKADRLKQEANKLASATALSS